jgi:hypothetical protein
MVIQKLGTDISPTIDVMNDSTTVARSPESRCVNRMYRVNIGYCSPLKLKIV